MKHATESTPTTGGHPSPSKPPIDTSSPVLPRALTLALTLALTSVATFVACTGTTAPEEKAADDALSAPAGPADAAVAYEPAYPEEVSAEGLSEEDAAQQAGEHAHGDETHNHGDGGEHHEHDDAHGEADHGDDEHRH